MRNAPLRCSSKATNVCKRGDFELKTCEGIWPIGLQKEMRQHTGWPLKANSYRKKIDTQKVYPSYQCAWHSALLHPY